MLHNLLLDYGKVDILRRLYNLKEQKSKPEQEDSLDESNSSDKDLLQMLWMWTNSQCLQEGKRLLGAIQTISQG